MSDRARGKRMVEEMILDDVLRSLPLITGREVTDEWQGVAEQVEGSPDFIIGLDDHPFGIELAEIREAGDAWSYFEEASRLCWQKHASYTRRGLFRFPIALVLHATGPALFDLQHQLATMHRDELKTSGFHEIWSIDFSDAYYSAGHPLRLPDMFCFKPSSWFGFHRIGASSRKPFG